MKAGLIIGYLFGLVLLGAAADGLNNSGVQTWGHLLEAFEILFAFMFLLVFKITTWREFAYALGAYICYRVFAFDYMYNFIAGNDWWYMGGNNWWDQFWVKQPPTGIFFGRMVFLAAGMAFPLNHLRR